MEKENNFPQDPLQRYHLVWQYIWDRIQRSLTRNQHYSLQEAFRSIGLPENFGYNINFDSNPSDDTLQKIKRFYELERFPNMRGKKPERFYDYWRLLNDYYKAFDMLKRLPSKWRNDEYRFKVLKDTVAKILLEVPFPEDRIDSLPSSILAKYNRKIDDKSLRRWFLLPCKELTVKIVAHIYRKKPEALRKALTKAKRELPPDLIESIVTKLK
jgi:hypothetical protein